MTGAPSSQLDRVVELVRDVLEIGEIRSKDAAADWVTERLPVEHRAVLERARAAYLGTVIDRWDELRAAVAAYAAWAAAEIRRLVDGPAPPTRAQ